MTVRAPGEVLIGLGQRGLPLLVTGNAELMHGVHIPGRLITLGRVHDVDARAFRAHAFVALETIRRVRPYLR